MSYVNTINIKRLTALINLVLITMGAYFSVALFYQILSVRVTTPQSTPMAAEQASIRESSAMQTVSYYNPIIERDLFKIGKTAQAPATGPSVDLESLEKTQLNLKLWGTVSGDPEQAYAVIEDTQKREQNLYRVGDTIQNATVKMILREKVILSVNGTDEILTMEEMDDSAKGPMIAARGGRSSRLNFPPSRPPREQRISINRSMIDEAFSDMSKLMTDIAITPHVEDGQTTGLNLNRIQPNSIFRRMGLRNGDVLTGVNGQPILTVEDAMQMYESLKSADNVQVQLKRRGQERNINYNIR